jgi:hypothetical protein
MKLLFTWKQVIFTRRSSVFGKVFDVLGSQDILVNREISSLKAVKKSNVALLTAFFLRV